VTGSGAVDAMRAALTDPHAWTVLGTTASLGAAAGAVGTLLVLRRRALLGDAVGHATLPGLVAAAIASVALGGNGREPWVLLAGAGIGALVGVGSVAAIQRVGRTGPEAAMAIALGTLFALGTLLLSGFQQTEHGHQAGIGSFLTGHAASLVHADLVTALGVLAATAITFVALSWDLRTTTFDPSYARACGRPTALLGILTAVLAVGTVVAGMQAVGLVLVLALLVIPPAAARCLSDRFLGVVAIAAAIGAGAGAAGSLASAAAPRVPTGAAIVLALGTAFLAAVTVGRLRRAA
jgi:manganese/zinc/iron transport system permease protein